MKNIMRFLVIPLLMLQFVSVDKAAANVDPWLAGILGFGTGVLVTALVLNNNDQAQIDANFNASLSSGNREPGYRHRGWRGRDGYADFVTLHVGVANGYDGCECQEQRVYNNRDQEDTRYRRQRFACRKGNQVTYFDQRPDGYIEGRRPSNPLVADLNQRPTQCQGYQGCNLPGRPSDHLCAKYGCGDRRPVVTSCGEYPRYDRCGNDYEVQHVSYEQYQPCNRGCRNPRHNHNYHNNNDNGFNFNFNFGIEI